MVDRMIQIRELKGRERCWSCFIYLFYLYIHFLKPYRVWDILPCCDRVQDIPRLKKEKKKGTHWVRILGFLPVPVSDMGTWPKLPCLCNIGWWGTHDLT